MPNSHPTVIVIFGISGDLAGRKILPALYHLLHDGLLPEKFLVIGTSRKQLNKDKLLQAIKGRIEAAEKTCDPKVLAKFGTKLEIIQFNPEEQDDYLKLKDRLNSLEVHTDDCYNRLFYLAIPPQVYSPIVRLLGINKLCYGCDHNRSTARLLVEKPFGYDLKSAKQLISDTAHYFKEEQVFRIDHYLAKETAQNILAFRANNPVFNSVWDNRLITRIQVRLLEKIGIEGRKFYDSVGALSDMIQSHLLQLLAITTMDLPKDLGSSNQIHAKKQQLLKKVKVVKKPGQAAIRAQYGSYRKEVGNQRSTTETYVRLPVVINNHKWSGVEISLETGKALAQKRSDIVIDFSRQNQLTIRLQPDEGIDIKLEVKEPGFDNLLKEAVMDFSYQTAFGVSDHPDAYERVLVDAIKGDQTLFASSQEIVRSWEILQPVLKSWQETNFSDLETYPNGSNGPELN